MVVHGHSGNRNGCQGQCRNGSNQHGNVAPQNASNDAAVNQLYYIEETTPQTDDHQPDHQIPTQIPPKSVMMLASPLNSDQSSHYNGSMKKYIFDSGCSRHIIGSSSLHLVTTHTCCGETSSRIWDVQRHPNVDWTSVDIRTLTENGINH